MTVDEILADDEDLEGEDVLATLSFATKLGQVKPTGEIEPIGRQP